MKTYKLYFLFKKRISLQIIKFASLFIVLIIFAGCNKNNIKIKDNHVKDQNLKEVSSTNGAYIPGPYFDWENVNDINFKGKQIPLPWVSGSPSANIPDAVLTDYHKKDGWVLLYNTFTLAQQNPFFALYNKFTGIARFYIYITIKDTAYVAHSITWGFQMSTLNCQTAAFNLNRTTPLPYSDKLSDPEIYNFNFIGGSSVQAITTGTATDSWYSSDVELSYDPNLANLSDQNIRFYLHEILTNTNYIQLDENIPDNLAGIFSLPSSGTLPDYIPNFSKVFSVSQYGYLKPGTTAGSISWLNNYISSQTNSLLKTQLRNAFPSLSTRVASSNILIKTMTNGWVYTNSNGPGIIHLNIKAKTSSPGNIAIFTSGPVTSLFYPGTKTSDMGGLMPNYNKQLGVFYIDKKPVIINTQSAKKTGGEYEVVNDLNIVLNSFHVVINPVVSGSCSKIKITKQIILTTDNNGASVKGTLLDSRVDKYKYLGPPSSTLEFRYMAPRPLPIIETPKIRITIAMTPIGETAPILLIKEFDATLIRNSYRPAR